VRREQLESLQQFEGIEILHRRGAGRDSFGERSNYRRACSDSTWNAAAFLGPQQRLELLVTIAWYNCVVRILLPLQNRKRAVVRAPLVFALSSVELRFEERGTAW